MLKGITSKRKGDSYCLKCFHSYRTKEELEKHMKETSCADLKKQAISIVDFEKKEMIKLTKDEQYKHDTELLYMQRSIF